MKKTLVALAVMVAAGSANAAIELYNKDGVTVNMKGDIEVRYKKAIGDNDTNELKQEIDDADFGFDTRYAMDDATQVGFYYEFSGADNAKLGQTGTFKVGNVYVGFYNDQFGSLKVGKLDTQLDDAGIGSDHLFGVNTFVDEIGFGGHEGMRYDYDNGALYLGLGVLQDKAGTGSFGTDGNHIDFKLGYRVADFNLTAFLGQSKVDGNDKDGNAKAEETAKTGAFEATYSGIQNVNLQAAYYMVKKEEADTDGSSIALAGDYTMNKWKFATGVSFTDTHANEDVTQWFLNAGYTIAPSTTAYVEIGDNNEDGKDLGYGVGIKAVF